MRTLFCACLVALYIAGCTEDETGDTSSSKSSTSTSTSTSTTTSSGGSGGTGGAGPGGAAGAGGSCSSADAIELTSTAVMDMGLLPAAHKCTAFIGGMNISPPLAWTPGPAGTLSYAIFFRDLTGANPFSHSAIWDIPGCTFTLPEDVDQTAEPADVPGAKQCQAYNGQFGYAGPCAPGFPTPRTYQFEIYAIDVATIPEITTDSSLAEVQAAFDMHSLASDTLTVMEDGDDP